MAAEPDALGSSPLSLGAPSQVVEEEGSAFGHGVLPLPSSSKSADKRSERAALSPAAAHWMRENKSNGGTSVLSGGFRLHQRPH